MNWKSHLKFPEEAGLSPEAKDLISRLLCNVNHRLGSKGADEIKVLYLYSVLFFELLYLLYFIFQYWVYLYVTFLQAHRFFKGAEWDKLYQIEAAFIPEVNDELDTQNFEKFDEVYQSIIFLLILYRYCSAVFIVHFFSFYLLRTCRLTAKLDRRQKLVHGGR